MAPEIPLHPNCMKSIRPKVPPRGATVFVRAVIGGAMYFLSAWVSMLFLGAAHSHDARVPDLGYFATTFVLLAFSWMVGAARFQHDLKEVT